MATVTLHRKRLRQHIRRHPWVYADSVLKIEGVAADGDVVRVTDEKKEFVAWAFYNSSSRLFLRMFSFVEEDSNPVQLFAQRARAAVALRRDVLRLDERTEAYRLVHSEGDGIPGLIVDRYGPYLVFSCTCLGTYRIQDKILDAISDELSIEGAFEVGSAKGLRGKEGLPSGRGVLRGTAPPPDLQLSIDGVIQEMSVSGGQKTGLFLDQRENARLFAATCNEQRVLDACCHGGFFAISALRGGASEAIAFDVSSRAVAACERNAHLNGVGESLSVSRADAFDELRRLRDSGERFGRVVLDPPKFAGTRRDVKKALGGYRELNSLALSLLEPGGILFTFTCSHHVTAGRFEETVQDAARRAGVALQVLDRRGPGADHAHEIFCPEGRYLSGLLLRRLA